MTQLRCSICVTAHNEEANIGRLLDALLSQELSTVSITEVVVVASGCTDATCDIVQTYVDREPRIRLLTQPRREGKTAAINLFLKHAVEQIVVVQSGDTLPRYDSIEHLIRPFAEDNVGMTGAQKVPVHATDTFIDYLSHLRLQLEHELCLEIPRLGELIAFRKIIDGIPADVAMDEAFMEAFILKRNLRVVYAPKAIVYNMGPQTVGDFIRQRRRNHAGHLHLSHRYGYKVSSLNTKAVASLAATEVWRLIKGVLFMGWAATLEAVARGLGTYDYYVRGRKHVVWDMAWSTKNVDVSKATHLNGNLAPNRAELGEVK